MKDIQRISGLEVVTVFGSMGLVGLLIFVILLDQFEDPGLKRAHQTALTLSGQLVAGGVSTSPAGSIKTERAGIRLPASVKKGLFLEAGDISKDPWGNPYHYRFLLNETGFPRFLFVWSDGPNKKAETYGRDLESQAGRTLGQISFIGDDIGVIRRLVPTNSGLDSKNSI